MMHRAMLPLLCLSAPLCAQTTHLVGPGGLPQIRDALAIAAPGDVIRVAAGTYAHFTADVGVTIRALVPNTVSVRFDPAFLPPNCSVDLNCLFHSGPTRFMPPSGQAVHVVGLTFEPTATTITGLDLRHRVFVESGTVTFDDCTIQAQDRPVLSVWSAQLHLQRCNLVGTGSNPTATALFTTDADVIAVDSVFRGSNLLGLVFSGHGATIRTSTLKASGCQFLGGTPLFGGLGGHALTTDAQSRIWISDSTLTGGGGQCAIAGVPAVGHIARSTLVQTAAGCAALLAAPVVGVERPTPIQNGASFDVLVHTEPNTLVAIHASPRLAHVEIPGLFAQPIALDLTSFFLAGLFVSDGNGDVTASWNMPAGQFVDETIWLEASAWLPGQPVLVGPVVGGVIR
mgnify:CR=1 FL=1